MNISFINSEFLFSIYPNLLTVEHPDDHIDINQLIEAIRHGYVKDVISELRAVKSKEKYKNIKRQSLPCVTLSGKFSHRSSKGLISHSGLIQIDIDQVDNYDSVFNAICSDEYTYLCFRSPGGKGIKAVIKINPSIETHLEQFYALERYYKDQYEVEIDKACKDIARCMLLSYDPNIYCNPNSDVFEELYLPSFKIIESKTRQVGRLATIQYSSNEWDFVENITAALEKNRIDITETYDKWIRVGYALCTSFGNDGIDYFQRISAYYPNYTTEETKKTYLRLLAHNDGGISLGTLVHFAREAGVDIKTGKADGQSFDQPKSPTFDDPDKDLFDKLKERRHKVSKQMNTPAYMIFSDKVLKDMVKNSPTTLDDFLNLSGVSYRNAEKFAQYFIPIIRKHKGIKGSVKLVFDENYEKKQDVINDLKEPEKALYQKLRKMRMRIANEEHIRPYWIFSNNTLLDLVRFKPKTFDALKGISGIGEIKVDWFGKEIIEIMNDR